MSIVRRSIYRGAGNDEYYEMESSSQASHNLRYFDARIYNNLILTTNKAKGAGSSGFETDLSYNQVGNGTLNIYPYQSYGSYSNDYYETPDSIEERIAELTEILNNPDTQSTQKENIQKQIDEFVKRRDAIIQFTDENENQMLAPHSLIHPYAVVKFAGMHGNKKMVHGSYLFDNFATRKWYEVDGDNLSSYAKTPTTTKIINWGSMDEVGRVPYRFQDFVFCKDWNIIPNNRMITLRRYFAPVSDNIEFDNYKEYSDEELYKEKSVSAATNVEKTNMTFAPLATAVTYFGEGTGNDLSSILSFSAAYNWKPLKAEINPITINAQANDMGSGLISKEGTGILSGAMMAMSFMTGFQGAMNGKNNPINNTAEAVPPDPYTNGPYENRILGPVNVIMDTIRRERGLTFKQENLKLKFSYVSRPIAGINNKAVLLDLLGNILMLCYASGTWFGGLERFRSHNRKMYPFTAGKVMNKLYKGQLLGKDGAIRQTTSHAFEQSLGLGDVLSEALKDMKNLVSSMWNGLMSVVNNIAGDKEGEEGKKAKAKEDMNNAVSGKFMTGLQSVLAAKVLSGASVPWINNKRALLTGDPVGEWHLTIGNPMNPIAMIGNLICDGVTITWSNELGPDDFPIGFDAEITLKHALGRDRDAIESMFNRGYGRIYSLPDDFRSSADFETKVDKYTGGVNSNKGRTGYDEWSETYFGGGGAFITQIEQNPLYNNGADATFPGLRNKSIYTSKTNLDEQRFINPVTIVTPFQMQWNL